MYKRVVVAHYEEAVSKLTYDLSSPSGLRHENGKPAGCQDKKGYWLVRIGEAPGKLLRAHRIIWFMFHGTLPNIVDHKDTITSNNDLLN